MGNSSSQSNVGDSLKSSPNYTLLSKLFEKISSSKDGERVVTMSRFKILLAGENVSITDLLYKYFTTITAEQDVCENLRKVPFISGFDRLLKLEYGSQDMVTFYVEMFSEQKQELTTQDIATIFTNVHSFLFDKDTINFSKSLTHFQVLERSLLCKEKNVINRDECAHQIFQQWPRLFNSVHCWILKSLSTEIVLHKPDFQEYVKIELLNLPDSSNILDPVSLWFLSISIPDVYLKSSQKAKNHEKHSISEWRPLYDSNEHGLSHNRFKHHCFSYRGPTVMTMMFANNVKLVLAVDVEWRESTKCFGDSATRLYQIHPHFTIISENNIILFNEKTRGLPVGLILGNNPNKAEVSILDGLNSARLGYLGGEETSVQRIQVSGCAGEKAAVDQKQQQNWEKRQAEKLQKVKLPGAWDENPDKAILDMAGITTEHARR